jgi:hypothetical protein
MMELNDKLTLRYLPEGFLYCRIQLNNKEGELMLGMGDFGIFLAYVLCIASTLACVIYGIFTWNKGAEKEGELKKDVNWEEKEKEIKENLDV